jgi:hypothetical protein
MVAGTGFVPDCTADQRGTITAHWVLPGVKHEAREIVRIGVDYEL